MIQLPVDVGLLMIYPWDEALSLHAQIHMAPGPDMAAVAPGTPAVARPGNAADLSPRRSEIPAVPGW
jgi:spore coat protein CotH